MDASAPAQDRASSQRTVTARRLDFDEVLDGLPKHFAGQGDLITSHFVAALSSTFPDGEDFFVRSVRAYRDQIADPVLKRQVAGFIGQEAAHGRAHRALNDRLSALGYPAKRFERFTKWSIGVQERFSSTEACLASTAAIEHATAILAEMILGDPEVRAMLGPQVGQVLLWHALEESEHKAVAFDVFAAVGGTERERVLQSKLSRWSLLLGFAAQTAISLAGDRTTYRRGELRSSWRRFKASPLLSPALWQQLKDYERPGFHPDDRPTDHLVAEWDEALFGEAGSLRPALVAVAG